MLLNESRHTMLGIAFFRNDYRFSVRVYSEGEAAMATA